jgi:hypothetical protein
MQDSAARDERADHGADSSDGTLPGRIPMESSDDEEE